MRYNLVSVGDQANLTVLVGGDLLVANEEHPNWQGIFKAVILEKSEDEAAIARLFDVTKALATKFEQVSERVSVANGRVYLDGDEVHGALSEQIVRFLEEDVEDWEPLVAFMERVSTNLNEHSREQLFEWLARHKFTVTDDGKFVAYKGVQNDGNYSSIHRGPGIVNGVPVQAVTNAPGSTVEIARSKVHHNPAVGCASGLHAGTFEYARGFGKVVLEVHVDPRDVVSVPTDCDAQKIRTCRYTVVREVTAPITTASTVTATVNASLSGPEYDSFSPDSTLVDYVEWDAEDGGLYVSLSNGNAYNYPNAPYSTFENWRAAPSAGAFYNREVRGRHGESAY